MNKNLAKIAYDYLKETYDGNHYTLSTYLKNAFKVKIFPKIEFFKDYKKAENKYKIWLSDIVLYQFADYSIIALRPEEVMMVVNTKTIGINTSKGFYNHWKSVTDSTFFLS